MDESVGKHFECVCFKGCNAPVNSFSCLFIAESSGKITERFCKGTAFSDEVLNAENLTDLIGEDQFKKIIDYSSTCPDSLVRIKLSKDFPIVSKQALFFDIKPVKLSDTLLYLIFPVSMSTDNEKLHIKLSDDLSNSVILAGGIAHDFNNLLMAILGNIDLAKLFSEPGSKAYTRLVKAEEAAFFGKKLTSQLLTFSESGRPDRVKLDIVDLLKKAINALTGEITLNITLRTEEDNLYVEVDEVQVVQVFVNLIRNIDKEASKNLSLIFVVRPVFRNEIPLEIPADSDIAEIRVIESSHDVKKDSLDPGILLKSGFALGLAISDVILRANGCRMLVNDTFENGSLATIYMPLSSPPRYGAVINDALITSSPFHPM
jgi:nitrogen-specific signal transduction histidine kinase